MAYSPNTNQNPATPGQNPLTPRQGPSSAASHFDVNPSSIGLSANPGTPYAAAPFSSGPKTPAGLQNLPYGGPGTPGTLYSMPPRTPGQIPGNQESFNAGPIPPHMMAMHGMRGSATGGMPMRGYMPSPDTQFGPPLYGIPTQALAGMPGGMQIPTGYQPMQRPLSTAMFSNAQQKYPQLPSGVPQYGQPLAQQSIPMVPPNQLPMHSSKSNENPTAAGQGVSLPRAIAPTIPASASSAITLEQEEIRAQQLALFMQQRQQQQAFLLAHQQQRQRHFTMMPQLPPSSSQQRYLSLPANERGMLQSVKIARHHLHEVFTNLMHLLRLTSEVDLPGTVQMPDSMHSVSKNIALEKIRRLNLSQALTTKVENLRKLHEYIMKNIEKELGSDILNDLSTSNDSKTSDIMAEAMTIEQLQEQSQRDLPPDVKVLLAEYNEVCNRAVAKRTAVRQLMDKTRDIIWSIDLTVPPMLNESNQ